MLMSDRPLIAISTGGERHSPRMPELYLQAVEAALGEAVFIGPDVSIIDAVRRYAGFIIPGGRDINPLLYNEERIAAINPEDEKRVNFDFALFHHAVKKKRPVLGICYGMQLINVALQGTLYQDISTQRGETIKHEKGSHLIQVNENPFIEEGRYEVNSSHHQAVKETGIGLDVFAVSPDGGIEAFYSVKHRFLLGVQWHPERMPGGISPKVFTSFIEACRALN
ncbi:MAG: gamma-glutamyl-gamma-aminobutyrate hydrolase family protein [Nitrospiraceae bacterium]|nr:MAG: gamma-glutamyl-gamma-aminobutyrate hydrolase family protein [Nitrospiraceae bacterium]